VGRAASIRVSASREADEEKANYRLGAELAWLSGDIVGFLNQFFELELRGNFSFVIGEDEVADMLNRCAAWQRYQCALRKAKDIGDKHIQPECRLYYANND
jgi:hypothetical protein